MSLDGWIISGLTLVLVILSSIQLVRTSANKEPTVRSPRGGHSVRRAFESLLHRYRGIPGPTWSAYVLLIVLILLVIPVLTGVIRLGSPIFATIAYGAAVLGCWIAEVVIVLWVRRNNAGRPPRLQAQDTSKELEKARRVDDLRRLVYGVAGALLKFARPKDNGNTRWDQVEPPNELLYKLMGQGEDVGAFVVPYAWRDDLLLDPYVKDHLLVTRLEGLLVYLKSVGLPSSA